MSIEAYTAVWERSQSRGSARLILLCLADHADKDGRCWPSIKRIANLTKVSARQVSRSLKDLDAVGEIKYEPGDGRGKHSHYVILLMGKDDTMSSINDIKDDICDIKDDTMSEKDDTMSSEPSLTVKEPSSCDDGVDFAEVARTYEHEIGMTSKIISDKMADAVTEFGGQLVIDAIGIAAENNVRKWSYVDGVLQRWRANGKGPKKAKEAIYR